MHSMESNHPDNDLLIKYLLKEVSTEEEAFVSDWIASDTRNQQEFETFEKVWLLISIKKEWDDIDIEEEWVKFKQKRDKNETQLITEELPQWQITNQTETLGRSKIYKLIVSIAVAASVLLIVALGWRFYANNKSANTSNIAVVDKKPNHRTVAVLRHEVNTTGKPRKIQLSDGTVIVLEDKSEVTFLEPLEANQRQITLLGKANFSVTKDKNRPFTVYSDASATTVLGTLFEVSAYSQRRTITVRLYEGKVVVNSATDAKRKIKKEVYLSPGYEMIYTKANASTSVQKFGKVDTTNKELINRDIANPDNLNIPKKNGSWYMFNNQPLSKVFDQLKEMYHAEIVYDKKEVQKLYFIGQFNKTDSLEMILEQITKANDLKLTISNDTFIINK